MTRVPHALMVARKEPPDSLDDFPTSPWTKHVLCKGLDDNDRDEDWP